MAPKELGVPLPPPKGLCVDPNALALPKGFELLALPKALPTPVAVLLPKLNIYTAPEDRLSLPPMKITIAQNLEKEVQSLCQQLLNNELPFINVVISGGSLIPLIGQNLNSPRVRIFFADERCVSTQDSASNYGTFIRGIQGELQCNVICPFEGNEMVYSCANQAGENSSLQGHKSHLSPSEKSESNCPDAECRSTSFNLPISLLNDAAIAYEEKIKKFFPNGNVQFDLLLLGIGPDGHTASLFPDDTNLGSSNALVVATNNAPKLPAQRISLSAACISAQQKGKVVFVAAGREKNTILQRVLLGELKENKQVPFSLFARNATFILDRESGEALQEGEF